MGFGVERVKASVKDGGSIQRHYKTIKEQQHSRVFMEFPLSVPNSAWRETVREGIVT
jgi:hypothetical protein